MCACLTLSDYKERGASYCQYFISRAESPSAQLASDHHEVRVDVHAGKSGERVVNQHTGVSILTDICGHHDCSD